MTRVERVESNESNESNERLYVVGIDVREIPEANQELQAYYKDRWFVVRAVDRAKAIEVYAEKVKGWLRDDEKPYLFVDELPAGKDIPCERRGGYCQDRPYEQLFRLAKYRQVLSDYDRKPNI